MEMIAHQGMSLESLSRGIVGMLVLIMIAYALSNNRKKIPWKVVGLGIFAQLIIAIGVIKSHGSISFLNTSAVFL